MKRTSSPVRIYLAALVFAVAFPLIAAAQSGSVEGRIHNAASGNYLENARVSIEGTNLQAYTTASGEYRLANVPPGEVLVAVTYSGFRTETHAVKVEPGQEVRQDFSLQLLDGTGRSGVVEMERFTVSEERLTTEALALNEQRVADNIKNVVAFEEFGNMGEGNPGEFLKYVPGVYITMGPAIAVDASIRGFPAEGTVVLVDGNPIASSTGTRAFELTGAATGNIDRLEVTKSPTPDLPANSIGGGINIKGKSAFSVAKPQLSYSAFFTFNLLTENSANSFPSFRKRLGSQDRTTLAPIQPGFDLTYLLPVNDRFGVALSAHASKRYYDQDFNYTYWDLIRNVMQRTRKQDTMQLYDKRLISAALDWKVGRRGKLRISSQYSSEDSITGQTISDFTYGPLTFLPNGDQDSTQSQPARATASSNTGGFNIYRDTRLTTMGYLHTGDDWKFEVNASYSEAKRKRDEEKDGYFTTFGANYTGLTMSANGFTEIPNGLFPRVTAVTNNGTPVDVFDGGGMNINSASFFKQDVKNTLKSASFNAERTLATKLPFKLKWGVAVTEDKIDQVGAVNYPFTIAVPAAAGPRTGNNLGLVAEEFSRIKEWRNIDEQLVGARFVSSESLFQLYREHPEYFTLNETTNHTSRVSTSKLITERITAGYVRFDTRLMENRLRIVTGVRYERTDDEALGPLDDITRTYQRDANGQILRNSAGVPLKKPGTAAELNRIQRVERGTRTERDYDGFYPSLNATYAFRENLLLRASYAKTIARPNLPLIIPSVTLPDLTSANRNITLTNSELTASTSDSYDLSFEYYGKGSLYSAGVFHKRMSNFIGNVSTEATLELLEQYGISEDYLGYNVNTAANIGDAAVTGLELSWRQPLRFLPDWARGTSLFANGTWLRRSGPFAEDLNSFAERIINYGVSYAQGKLLVKLNVSDVGHVQLARVATSAMIPENTFRYNPPQTTVDLSIDYRFHKKLSFFFSGRNLLQDSKITSVATATTPSYAEHNVYQRIGTLLTVGIKGTF